MVKRAQSTPEQTPSVRAQELMESPPTVTPSPATSHAFQFARQHFQSRFAKQLEHASAHVPEPSPSPSRPLDHAPTPVPKPCPNLSSPLRNPLVKSVPKDVKNLRSRFQGYLHLGKVLTVEGPQCTIKWQTDKKPYPRQQSCH